MIALAVVSAVLVTACVQIKTSPSNETESMATETRNVAPFIGIDFALPGTLHVSQSDTQSVQVDAASDVISSIRTEVTNRSLTIDAAQPIVTTKPITIHISVSAINQISNDGAGTVVSDSQLNSSSLNLTVRGAGTFDVQLNATQLITQLSGAGTANLRGTATNHAATLTGVGTLRSYELQTETTSIEVTGVGSAEVTALQKLVVNITGTGSVMYHGSPQVSEQHTGIGAVQKTG